MTNPKSVTVRLIKDDLNKIEELKNFWYVPGFEKDTTSEILRACLRLTYANKEKLTS